jgi:hypothetical protein
MKQVRLYQNAPLKIEKIAILWLNDVIHIYLIVECPQFLTVHFGII